MPSKSTPASGKTGFPPAVSHRIDRAEKHCRAAGASLTATQRTVFGLLAAERRPMGAYELLDLLSRRTGRRVAPPTVYRAIDVLARHGLVARVTSRNAFVLCAHPGHDHDCIFFICDSCGTAREVEDSRFERLLRNDAEKLGFRPSRRILEIEGKCRSCQ